MNKKNIKGLNDKKLSIGLIVLEAILFLFAIFASIEAFVNHRRVSQLTDDYIRIQKDIYSVQAASDYLSSKARQYVMTGEIIFAVEYFEEVDDTQRRDGAIEDIHAVVSEIGYGATEHIEKALEKSNHLMERETHAMALIATTVENQSELDRLPEIKTYELSDTEKKLDRDGKDDKAYSLVFGGGYSEEKTSIRQSVEKASESLLGDIGEYKSVCTDRYQRSFSLLMVLISLLAIVFVVIAVCLFAFVLRPLSASIESIQAEKLIPYSDSYELNYLAATYNEVFEANATTRLHLKSKAERDELTGLLNRSAFNDLVDFYKDSTEALAFLILDVDYFKTVNDTYGHAIGDLALKKVASLLDECFRSNDFPIRYGGDEFAVIMTEIGNTGHNGVIRRKIDYINNVLQNPVDDIPKLSISVGVAFSEHGFGEDLFKRADDALYKTKENGRCGYTFAE